jgi:hypothetical protein
VDLGTVQRQLGHSSPETTEAFYDHSDVFDDRAILERVLTFETAPATEPAEERTGNTGRADGITTGSPSPVTPPAAGAPSADPALPWASADSSPCDSVRPVAPGGESVDHRWGASGRRFKSCRPDI